MPAPRGGRDGEEHDPALVVRRARHGGPDHVLVVHRDYRVILLARGENLGEGVDGLDALVAHLVPQAQDGIHVGGLVVAQA